MQFVKCSQNITKFSLIHKQMRIFDSNRWHHQRIEFCSTFSKNIQLTANSIALVKKSPPLHCGWNNIGEFRLFSMFDDPPVERRVQVKQLTMHTHNLQFNLICTFVCAKFSLQITILFFLSLLSDCVCGAPAIRHICS